jgi:hypothetical protein
LKYYLPKISKLFKIRLYYTNAGVEGFQDQFKAFTGVTLIFTNFKRVLDNELRSAIQHYTDSMKSYNIHFLETANKSYILVYAYVYLKFRLYKKLYL